jgi:hypothetical protein
VSLNPPRNDLAKPVRAVETIAASLIVVLLKKDCRTVRRLL